jgi:two-component system, OmpR family, sensor histidine kinase KdpD
MRGPIGRTVRAVLIVVALLAVATLAVAALEDSVGVANASSAFLVAVVAAALLVGTRGAVVTAVGSAALYNFWFTEPRFTFAIHDSGVLLSVVLLLFVGVTVGELAALQRRRADAADAAALEARALFSVSRALATRTSMEEAAEAILTLLAGRVDLQRAWIGTGPEPAAEVVLADSGDGRPPVQPARVRVLQRTPDEESARWSIVQRPGIGSRAGGAVDTYRVRIEASGEPLGSLWAERLRGLGDPDPVGTRLLAAVADQVGQALAHDLVEERVRAVEIARESDALKSALLQSVSHDLRTPLATIRAAAGSLRPGTSLSDEDRRASADAIEREVEYLNRMVTNLLDLSRIEAGVLRATRELFDLDDLLARALDSTRQRLGGRTLETDLRCAPVEVDAVFADEAVTNVLDNALKHTPDTARIRVTARDLGPERVRLTVEDDGPGVAPQHLDRLFEKFYRAPGSSRRSREGTGIGLAVTRGLVEAMGGTVGARASDLGGLAVDIDLPAGAIPETLGALDALEPLDALDAAGAQPGPAGAPA